MYNTRFSFFLESCDQVLVIIRAYYYIVYKIIMIIQQWVQPLFVFTSDNIATLIIGNNTNNILLTTLLDHLTTLRQTVSGQVQGHHRIDRQLPNSATPAARSPKTAKLGQGEAPQRLHLTTVQSIVIFFNDYPDNYHTIQFKYILLSTTV